jgi:hypothetical protein
MLASNYNKILKNYFKGYNKRKQRAFVGGQDEIDKA